MASPKVLVNITYGAFSCTLQNIDDPGKLAGEIAELLAKVASTYPEFGQLPVETPPMSAAPDIAAKGQEPVPAPTDPQIDLLLIRAVQTLAVQRVQKSFSQTEILTAFQIVGGFDVLPPRTRDRFRKLVSKGNILRMAADLYAPGKS